MEKINLNEILKSQKFANSLGITEYISEDGFVWKLILKAMKEACEESIEHCALNAKTTKANYKLYESAAVDKDSILSVKKLLS